MRKETILSSLISQTIFFLLFPVWKQLVLYLHEIVIPVVWICITGLVFFSVYYIRKIELYIPRKLILCGLFLYTMGLIILLFFRPQDQNYHEFNLIPFNTISYFLSGESHMLVAFYNLSANVLLFIPFGVFAPYFDLGNRWKLLLFPIGIISLIEILQMALHRGSLDIDDLLLNVSGIYVGYILSSVVKVVIKLKR